MNNLQFMTVNNIWSFVFIFLICILFPLTQSKQQFRMADISQQVGLQWSFVSQIHHTWLQNIIKTYFTNCSRHQQLKALYNCNTTIEQYNEFWKQFIMGIQQIKFKSQVEQGDHQWSDMMIEAAQQWIIVNKTSPIIEIEQAYEDIKDFPNNLMEFAQFYEHYQSQFSMMEKLTKWKRDKKSYMLKKDKENEQMERDQMTILKKYFDRNCFKFENYMTTCKMPLERYSYYLKDMFFYFFEQPQKYSQYDKETKLVAIDPLLDYKITKLWRDMRDVMRKHLNIQLEITLEEVEKMSIQILQSVIESLVRKNIGKNNGKVSADQYEEAQL